MSYFTGGDLAAVERFAQAARALDDKELTVARLAREGNLSEKQMAVVDFCAGECHRQKSGALSVYWMCTTYNRAAELGDKFSVDYVLELAALIEPAVNRGGFRTTPVTFSTADMSVVLGAENVAGQVESLVTHGDLLSALEFYVYFEEIHPFADGNGREGAILYNVRGGTMDAPRLPPRIDFAARRDRKHAPVEDFILD